MNESKNSGLGIATVLTFIFVVLKLCKVISWSWWWVLSPILIDFAIAILVFLIALVVGLLRK